MKKSAVLLILFLALQQTACNKADFSDIKGSFSGMFTYSNPAWSVAFPAAGRTTLTFEGNRYSCSGNPNYFPAGGSGTFEFLDAEHIRFDDENVWTANFDWGLILDGEYRYQQKGDSLTLVKYQNDRVIYEYKLKRDPRAVTEKQ